MFQRNRSKSVEAHLGGGVQDIKPVIQGVRIIDGDGEDGDGGAPHNHQQCADMVKEAHDQAGAHGHQDKDEPPEAGEETRRFR